MLATDIVLKRVLHKADTPPRPLEIPWILPKVLGTDAEIGPWHHRSQNLTTSNNSLRYSNADQQPTLPTARPLSQSLQHSMTGVTRPSGVTYHDPARAYKTHILFTGADNRTRLIDLQGNVVKCWPYGGAPPKALDPALSSGEKGQLGLQLTSNGDSRGGIWGNATIGRVNWEGEVLWEWGANFSTAGARQNHDFQILPNGNWLVVVTVKRVVEGLSKEAVGDQGLVEVDPATGEVVWRWSSGDHISEFGLSDDGLRLLREAVAHNPGAAWGCLEMNSATVLGPNKWYSSSADDDSNDPAFHPENIIISFRKANIVAIISKSTGSIVWKLGPYFPNEPSGAQHSRILRHDLPRPLDQISGQHNPHLIPPGLPGEGNILLFDCQSGAGYPPSALGIYAGSRILEVNPLTKQIVWQYTAQDSGLPPWTFFSSFVSNAQRLPGGNTLVTEGMNGRLFQITPKGDVVWEYWSPYEGAGTAGEPEGEDGWVDLGKEDGGEKRASRTWLVYRSYAVDDGWIPDGVAGKERMSDGTTMGWWDPRRLWRTRGRREGKLG